MAEQNTRLATRLLDAVQRYEDDLGDQAVAGLHSSLLAMLITGASSETALRPAAGRNFYRLAITSCFLPPSACAPLLAMIITGRALFV